MKLLADHRRPAIGRLHIGHGLGGDQSISVSITGLTSNAQYSNFALVGGHASIGGQMSDLSTITAYKWSAVSAGGTDLGTGAAPTDFTAADTGDKDAPAVLYLRATAGGIDYDAQVFIRAALATFSVQPTITGTLQVGQTLTLTEGTATGSTLTITTFELDGVAKSGELVGLNWDTTGENVYSAAGLIEYQVTAETSGGITLSNLITATLTDVPDTFVLADWSAAAGGNGEIDVTIASLPDNGNSTITDVEYRIDAGIWTSSGGTVSFTVTGLAAGSRNIEIRAINSVGNAATSDTKSVTVTAGASITLSGAAYTAGSGGNPPSLAASGIVATGTTGPYYLDIVTHANGTTISQSEMTNGNGDVIDKVTLGPQANIDDLDGNLTLSTSVVNGNMTIQYRDSAGTPTLSALTASTPVDGVDIDATPPAFSSAELTDTTTARVTLDSAMYGSTVPGDWTLTGNTISAVAFTPGNAFVDLTLGTPATGTDDYTGDLSYSGSTLTDASANALASFSGQNVANSLDTTAPVLTSPTAAKNGTNGATSLGVTTDEGNGTLYWGIYPTASTPSAADVVAGTGATVSGSQAVSATGVQAVANQTGLSAATAYKAHYVHDDSSSNRSNLSTSAEFTTDAASGFSDNFVGRTENLEASADYSVTGGSAYVSGGSATLDGAQIYVEGTIDAAAALLADCTWSVEVNDKFEQVQLSIRYTDPANYIKVVFYSSGSIDIVKNTAGAGETPLASADRSVDMNGAPANEICNVTVSGSSISANWNVGTNVSATETDHQSATGKRFTLFDFGAGDDASIIEWSVT